jgi:Ca-activated chloride channel family protein
MWARRKIDALQSRLGSSGGGEAEAVKKTITETALRHHIVSRYTSLLAVDRTPVRKQGSPLHERNVPVNLPAGWHYGKVFGSLPQTGLGIAWHLLAGLLALCVAVVARIMRWFVRDW